MKKLLALLMIWLLLPIAGAEETYTMQDGSLILMDGAGRKCQPIAMKPDFPEALLADADVLVENYRPGTLEKMGLSWDELHKLNPKLILASISGFGQSGPMAGKAGFDSILQATSGLMSLTGSSDGEPYLMGTFVIDYCTSIYCAYAVLAALIQREKTGEGQRVELSLMDTAASLLIDAIPEDILLNKRRSRIGNLDKCTAPVGCFRDKNGEYVYIIAAPQAHWLKLADIIGRPELADDPRFKTVPVRHAHAAEVNVYVEEWMRSSRWKRSSQSWTRRAYPRPRCSAYTNFCSSTR